jgi:hypothetical protein
VYTKNVPHVSREKFYLAAQRIKILDRQNEFLRACHDVCIKGRKNAFGIWEGDSSFHYDIRNLASRYGLLLDQSKIATESVKVEETPFIPHGIPRERRFEHTLILADTGWGKTWLMKKLAWHYAKERDSVIIVDSEGSEKGGFVKDALSWRKDADVIYIDFTDPENVPCLSMFDVKLSDEPRERERIMNGTMDLYRYVFTSLLGAGKTANQMTLLENIAQLMLHIPEANISTIKSVLFDINPYRGNVRKLGEHARDFFERDFPTKEWKEVARQVMNRINSVLSNPVLARVLTQSKSKIDLFKAINTGKMIVVNVNRSHLGDAAGLLGRFFIAIQCQAALRREEDVQYRPAFLFVDEAWRYFDEKIEEMLNTIRKRRLGLVIGTQQISQFKNVSMSLRTAAFQSAIKFAGMMTDAENTEVIKELGLDPKSSSTRTLIQKKEGEKLFASEFFVHIKGQQAKKVNIDFTDVQNAPRLSKTEIKELFEDNNRLYCEKVRVRGERAEAATGETVYEPDEQGVLRPRGLPQPDRSDDFWQ